MIPTVLDPQQLLKVLLGFGLHDGLTGTDVWKRHGTLRSTGWPSHPEPKAVRLTQAEQPVLLLQAFEFLRHKRLHLLDVHPLTLLQRNNSLKFSHRSVTTATTAHTSPHIIRRLQVPGLLTEVAKDVGEMLISDLAEDLNGSPDVSGA